MHLLHGIALLCFIISVASGWVIGEHAHSKVLSFESPSNGAIDSIMQRVDSNLTGAIDQMIMSKLDSVLMLENTRYSKDLRAHVEKFKDKLVVHMRSDLTETIAETKNSRSRNSNESLTDDEKNDFVDKLHDRWDNTLRKELSDFRDNLLPKWVSKTKKAWQGIKAKVRSKIEKFKGYMHRHSVKRISAP